MMDPPPCSDTRCKMQDARSPAQPSLAARHWSLDHAPPASVSASVSVSGQRSSIGKFSNAATRPLPDALPAGARHGRFEARV
jgi:hypothetical protein